MALITIQVPLGPTISWEQKKGDSDQYIGGFSATLSTSNLYDGGLVGASSLQGVVAVTNKITNDDAVRTAAPRDNSGSTGGKPASPGSGAGQLNGSFVAAIAGPNKEFGMTKVVNPA